MPSGTNIFEAINDELEELDDYDYDELEAAYDDPADLIAAPALTESWPAPAVDWRTLRIDVLPAQVQAPRYEDLIIRAPRVDSGIWRTVVDYSTQLAATRQERPRDSLGRLTRRSDHNPDVGLAEWERVLLDGAGTPAPTPEPEIVERPRQHAHLWSYPQDQYEMRQAHVLGQEGLEWVIIQRGARPWEELSPNTQEEWRRFTREHDVNQQRRYGIIPVTQLPAPEGYHEEMIDGLCMQIPLFIRDGQDWMHLSASARYDAVDFTNQQYTDADPTFPRIADPLGDIADVYPVTPEREQEMYQLERAAARRRDEERDRLAREEAEREGRRILTYDPEEGRVDGPIAAMPDDIRVVAPHPTHQFSHILDLRGIRNADEVHNDTFQCRITDAIGNIMCQLGMGQNITPRNAQYVYARIRFYERVHYPLMGDWREGYYIRPGDVLDRIGLCVRDGVSMTPSQPWDQWVRAIYRNAERIGRDEFRYW